MVKRPTWILLILLALVIGGYFMIKSHPFKTAVPTPTVTEEIMLVTQVDGALQRLRIYDQKRNVFQMQRDLSKSWVITEPYTGAADQSLAGAAESQVGALRVLTDLDTPPDISDMGLTVPADTLELMFVNGTSHKIEVGNLTPTSSGYYVRYDTKKYYVISQSGIDALLKLLTSPPYPATMTPLATVESAGSPTPDSAESPTP